MERLARIGFIGLGRMGSGIARNLVRKRFPVTVVGHRNRMPVDELKALGAMEAETPAAATALSDIIFICVSDSPAVESIVYGPNGIMSTARPGLIVIDCTTSEPSSTASIAADFAKHGTVFVDAPVARSPEAAEAGKLTAMVGATDDIYQTIKPVLEAFCENIFHVGGCCAGHTTKLIYNFLTMGQAALIAEALATAKRSGLPLLTFCNVVQTGAANSGVFQMMVASKMTGARKGFDFGLHQARKDVRYYTNLTEQLGLPSFLGETVHQSFVRASAMGFGDRPVSALVDAQETIRDHGPEA